MSHIVAGGYDRIVTVTLPLSALLSRALVAFTIEFDNEFEHRMPHRTARGPAAHSGRGPWLVSMAMWSNFMRYLDADRTPLGEVEDLVALTNLGGMQRWGYVTVDGDAVGPTTAGRQAQEIWQPLAAEIEGRWRERYGDDVIEHLRQALAGHAHPALPRYLPVIAVSQPDRTDRRLAEHHRDDDDLDLSVLLSRALMAHIRDFERDSRLSLPLSANVLRALREPSVRVRDLPLLAGVAKEQVSLSVGFLEKRECLTQRTDNRTKIVKLTAKGKRAQAEYRKLVRRADDDKLRSALEAVGRLEDGLTPHPDGWRAHPPYRSQTMAFLKNDALPHCPIVSHRGGFPDGS